MSMSQQEHPEPAGIPGECLRLAFLIELKVSKNEDERLKNIAKLPRQVRCRCPLCTISSLSNVTCPPTGLSLAKHHINLNCMPYQEPSISWKQRRKGRRKEEQEK